ncbi:hypothetical protein CLNEO_05270 [Anaerotignum neopropionicum]|uniref:Uncharacterized protein n=1 Tax=Anaerotignum neopropionicum TaxID=36847 RepID=A0A136WIS7_9FIRM|nr:hypothetical protein [Anaerotignum neopropionicum]KXL54421.1 hypothetical protein CLNEO_05270 [Anaerotignum neopropionicum]
MFTLTANNPVLKIISNKIEISFETDYKSYEVDALKEKFNSLNADKLTLKVSKFRKNRSLDANAYMWVLCDKLAEKLNIAKLEVYRQHIKDIGVFREVEIDEKSVDTLIHSWSLNGTGWIAEKLDYSNHDGFTIIALYYGSSVYNTKQMSRLIDGIVQDCKDQGIETLTPDELQQLKEAWK